MNKKAVLITAFGTTNRAGAVYEFYIEQLKDQIKEVDYFRAYTSNFVIKKLNERAELFGSEKAYNVEDSLNMLVQKGYKEIYINSLHIVPGVEYMKIVRQMNLIKKPSDCYIMITTPLLLSNDNVVDTVKALGKLIKEDCINVAAVHGTQKTHPSYNKFKEVFQNSYKNSYAAAVEGEPRLDEILHLIKENSLSKVNVIPTMFVAGMHISDDVLGEKEDSWKNIFASFGKTTECPEIEYNGEKYYEGLGFNPDTNKIFIENLKTIIQRTGNKIKFEKGEL